VDDIDLTDARIFGRGFPHDLFTTLRREAPVYWQPFSPDFPGEHDPGFWVLSRHADVQAANRDTELFCSHDGPQLSIQPAMRGTMLVSMDGRDHVRQRRLISAGFTPRMVGRLEAHTRKWAISIIEQALERGTCDFVQDVAYRLPMHMIADIVGIPVDDREWLFGLTKELLAGSDTDHVVSPDELSAIQVQMFEYAQDLGRRKRAAPQDDVWTVLTTVEIETDDGEHTKLGETELDMFFFLLTIAGSETTRNAISGGLVALVEHSDQLARLRSDPDAMKPAVEEILRWTSPVAYFARRATRPTEIRGVPIAEGDRITLWYPSANRDEEVFEDPFRFDIRRTPNNHVAFGGGGPHFCLGANLARHEIAIMFEELLARTTNIEILAPPTHSGLTIDNPVLGAVRELPVRLT
jgi:cytochrome P450